MKFSLVIRCDNAAFDPINDDAGEAERYAAAGREVGRLIGALGADLHRFPNERSGVLYDSNGNRCGSWSLSEEASPKGLYWAMREEAYLGDPAWSLFEDGQRVAVGLTKADAERVCLAMNAEA